MSAIFNDVPAFNKAVDASTKRIASEGEALHKLLVSALVFSFKDGNVVPAAYLFNKVGNNVNREGMAKWLGAHGIKIAFSAKAKEYGATKIKDGTHDAMNAKYSENADNAVSEWLADHFADRDYNKTREFGGIDVDKIMLQAFNRVEKALKDENKARDPRNNLAGIDAWRALVKQRSPKGETTTLN